MGFQKVQDITSGPIKGSVVYENELIAADRTSKKYVHVLYVMHGLGGSYHQFDALLKYNFPFALQAVYIQNADQNNYSKNDQLAIVDDAGKRIASTHTAYGYSQGAMDGLSMVYKTHSDSDYISRGNGLKWFGFASLAGKYVGAFDYSKIKDVRFKVWLGENDTKMGKSSIRFAEEFKAFGGDVESHLIAGAGHTTMNTMSDTNPIGFFEWYVRKIQEWEKSQEVVEEPTKHVIRFERDIVYTGVTGTVYSTDMGCETHAIITIPDTTNGRINHGLADYVSEMQLDYPLTVISPDNSPGANFSSNQSKALDASIICKHKSFALVGAGKGVMEASNVLKPRIGFMGIIASKTGITDFSSFKGIVIRIWRGTKDYEIGNSIVPFFNGLKAAGVDVKMFEVDEDHDTTVRWALDPGNEIGFFEEHRKYVASLGK